MQELRTLVMYGMRAVGIVFIGVMVLAGFAGDIVQILKDSGFKRVDIVETREERNGSRVLLLALRN